MARILSEGSKFVDSRHSDHPHHISARETSSNPPSSTATEAVATGKSTAVPGCGINDSNSGTSFTGGGGLPAAARDADDVKTLPFEVFLRACNVYFCFQVRFEAVGESRACGRSGFPTCCRCRETGPFRAARLFFDVEIILLAARSVVRVSMRLLSVLAWLFDATGPKQPFSYLPHPLRSKQSNHVMFMNVFAWQEFFEDVRALFGSLAFRSEGGGNTNNVGGGRGDDAKVRAAREVNLRILLDQLQVMKAEPRNQLRCPNGRASDSDMVSLKIYLCT